MLAKRIIPSVLVRGKTAYKGPGFGERCTRSVGSALSICRTHAMRGVDELLILDIGATPEGRGPDLDLVRDLSAGCYIPITVGGGVRTIDDIDALLRAGADKVAIGAAAREEPEFVTQAADRFGVQAIVFILEHNSALADDGQYAFIVPPEAGEIVVQCRDFESSMSGYDLTLARHINDGYEAKPVIVSGGCAGPHDMLAAFQAGADGCAAGALFQFTDHTPRSCAAWLKAKGVEVRCN